MTAVLRSPSHLPSSPNPSLSEREGERVRSEGEESGGRKGRARKEEEDQLSLLAVLVTLLRKSMVGCSTERKKDFIDIGWPTNVRHVAHVTFDRLHGFLGLPVEFEPEVSRRALSASANVFGVSAESMQCSFDPRGNSVPIILLLMQRRLYSQGGLQAEGIFRINAENSQEEHVRDQLNSGIVPDDIDVHCLAGMIKAWFRELPTGVLDTLRTEQVMQCQSEEQCIALVKLLPPTESALLDWAINLMADVVQVEHCNKMNAHNIAMVFAPNMTQMADPFSALMHVVQVMNFLKTLIERTLKERKNSVLVDAYESHSDPTDESGRQSSSCVSLETCTENGSEFYFTTNEPVLENPSHLPVFNSIGDDNMENSRFGRDSVSGRRISFTDEQRSEVTTQGDRSKRGSTTVIDVPKKEKGCGIGCRKNKCVQSSNSKQKKGAKRQPALLTATPVEKSKGISIINRISSRAERVEAWR